MSKTKSTDAAADAKAARGVLQRRESIGGVWYPHGVVLTASEAVCESLRGDGAMDMHPDAIEHALRNGAPELTYEPPAAVDPE